MIIVGLTLFSPHELKRLKKKQVATSLATNFLISLSGMVGHDRYILSSV